MSNKMKLACGRKESDAYNYCSNPDYSWRSNKLIIEKVKVVWNKYTHRPKIFIHYRIECKKCGALREQGNYFGFSEIKQLLTGKFNF